MSAEHNVEDGARAVCGINNDDGMLVCNVCGRHCPVIICDGCSKGRSIVVCSQHGEIRC